MKKTFFTLIGLSLGSTHAMDTAQIAQPQNNPGLEARALAEKNGPESLTHEQLCDAIMSLTNASNALVLKSRREDNQKNASLAITLGQDTIQLVNEKKAAQENSETRQTLIEVYKRTVLIHHVWQS